MIDALYLAFKDAWSLDATPLRLLHFTTSRMILAFLTSFLVTFYISPRMIEYLFKRDMRNHIRDYEAKASSSKVGAMSSIATGVSTTAGG